MLEAVVTGSTGFIGSHLVESLLKKGFNVRCLLRKGRSNEHHIKDLTVEKFYIPDYSVNELAKSSALKNVDYIFHTAGVTKGITLKDFKNGNTAPTIALLSALINGNADLKRFIYVSSGAAAGPAESRDEPVNESMVPAPIEHYGTSKFLGELAVRVSKVPSTIVRPGGVYGPRDVDYFNLFKSIYRRLNPFFGNKNKFHSIIHVDDLVDAAINAALSENTKNETYFLCNDEPVSWEELQSLIVDAAGRKVLTVDMPSFFMDIAAFFGELCTYITKKPSLLNRQKLKLSKPDYWVFSNKKAKRDFGFEAKVSLEEGVKETHKWYCRNKWL